jgi:hypothetical protein
MLLGEALDDLSKGKYKIIREQLYRLDDLANNNTKKHSISTQGILVFKTKKLQQRRKNDSGSLFKHQGIQRNHVSSVVINTFQPKGISN